MKKLLSLLSVLMVGGSSTLTVVACSNNSGSNINPDTDVNANVKTWSQQSSNIAKSIILGKTDNLNTNNILENGLKHNVNDITNAGSSDTGADYTTFSKTWGYNGTIQGITDKDFNSNTASTIDNNAKNTNDKIGNIFKQISTYLPLAQLMLSANLKDNKTFNDFIMKQDGDKGFAIANTLWDFFLKNNVKTLKNLPSYLSMAKKVLPLIQPLFTNLAAFNPQKTLGTYYSTNIKEALFTKDGGWLKNYHPTGDDTIKIDSVTKNSDILQGKNQDIFKTWNQVALFKAGADLNTAFASMGPSLSDIFQSAITFDSNGTATGFDKQKFADGIVKIYNSFVSDPLSIIPFVGILVPIVKFQLGFEPNQDFKTVTNQEPTDSTKGIINIKDVFDKISNILFSKDGFTSFFTNLFFPKSVGEYTDANFLTLDITCHTKGEDQSKNNFAVSEIIVPIEETIKSNLNTLYDTYLEPFFKENNVQDIFNKVENDLAGSTKKFDFNISYVQTLLDIINSQSLSDMLDELAKVTDEKSLQDNWEKIWNAAGMQTPDKLDFVQGSVLGLLQPLATSPDFWKNIGNLLSNIGAATTDVFNTFIDKINEKTSEELDFNNKTLWLIDDKSISFQYDKDSNQSTISYNITYKGKTYQVSVVVNTNAHDTINNSQQVWLKSLTGLN